MKSGEFLNALKKQDEWYTPRYAVEGIAKYVKEGAKVWCPFDTERSFFVKVLEEHGCTVCHTHIDEGADFFDCDIPECDYIVSNPPFSKKNEVLARLDEIGKPYAMLLPSFGIFEGKRFEIVRNGGQILVFDKRIRFFGDLDKPEENMANPPFSSVYLCKKMLPQQIVFEHLNIPTRKVAKSVNAGDS